MTNPQDALIPQQIIGGVLATLAAWQQNLPAVDATTPAAPLAAPRLSASTRPDPHRPHATIDESIACIPTGRGTLFGMLTRPVRTRSANPPAVLMLNPGAVHHIGPNRLWVTLARRWAARGVTVLRIDLSGIADSPARDGEPENVVYTRQAGLDIVDALRYLRETCGAGDCHLVGLCSGAFHALKAVVAGERVASAIMINPLTFSWDDCTQLGEGLNEYELLENARRYRRELLSPQVWSRLVRGDLDLGMIARMVAGRGRHAARQGTLQLRRAFGLAPATDLAGELARSAKLGARLHFVFAEGEPGLELLQRHGGRGLQTLRARGQLSIALVADGDHTYTDAAARGRLIAQLDELLATEMRARPHAAAADADPAEPPSWFAPLTS